MSEGGLIGLGAGGCCCCFCTIFLIVFFATSIKKVDQTESCLQYSWWSESVDEEILTEPGMRWVGMGNYLVCFPNYNLYVYFRDFAGNTYKREDDIYHPPITVRTQDGLTINLEMEFVYKLQAQNLRNLYFLVGPDDAEGGGGYRDLLSSVAEGIIDNHATNYDAIQFYSNRTGMSVAFREELKTRLAGLYIDVHTLQLQPAIFPARYSQAIVDTLNAKQDIQVADQEYKTQEIIKQTDKMKATMNSQVILINAFRDSNITVLQNNISVETFVYAQEKKAAGYSKSMEFFTSHGGNVPDFMEYLGVRALDDHKTAGKTVQVTPVSTR